jgi:hypothetical protein
MKKKEKRKKERKKKEKKEKKNQILPTSFFLSFFNSFHS